MAGVRGERGGGGVNYLGRCSESEEMGSCALTTPSHHHSRLLWGENEDWEEEFELELELIFKL